MNGCDGMDQRVVISGMGVISPLGDSGSVFFENMYSRQCGISKISLFDPGAYRSKLAAEIGNFDAEKYLGKKGLRNMDRSTKLVLSAFQTAVTSAHYPLEDDFDPEIGVVVGNTFGSLKSISEYDRISILDSPSNVSPMDFANCVINCAAGNVGIRMKGMCVNVTLSNGISSALDAFGYAADFIKVGRAKMLMAGGVEELCEETFYGFHHAGLMAFLNDFNELCGPFDPSATGIVLGEGAALFTLEPLALARERGAAVYGEVAGYGRYFNQGENTVTSMERCMRKALNDARVAESDIDAVIASANGYRENDRDELVALEKLFQGAPAPVPVTSIKGAIGECYSAGGAFQVLAGLGMVQRNEITGVIHAKDFPPGHSKVEIVGENLKKSIDTVLINSFGFSGSNASLVLKRVK